MANVGFKLGSQATANLMLANPDNYDVHAGHFYLTSDTHRLYIGALPTSTAADGTVTTTSNTPRLFPLNEGIVTVSDLNHLPVFTAGTPEELAAIGTFYYVEDGNILCIYGGTESGNGWIQVNANTDTNIEGITYNLTPEGENKAIITLGLKDSQGKVIEDKISITVKGGLTSSIIGDDLEIVGDTYTLILESADETDTNFNIKLNSSNTENDTQITLEAGDGVSLTKTGNNKLKITAEEANQIVDVSVEKGYVPESADKEGFRVSLKSKSGALIESANFNPKIQYGVSQKDTVPFKDGVAILEAYTAAEIQKILRELNAMHYLGTIGANGSAAQQLVTYGNNGLKIMKADNTELQVKIGDMFIVSQTIDNPLQIGANYPTGTILICNSDTGAEDPATGYIDSDHLYLESIESTLDSDTTYTLAKNSTGNGVVLTTKNSGDYGEFKVTTPGEEPGDSGILLSYNWSGTSERPVSEISIQHVGIDTTSSTMTEEMAQESGINFTIPVIKEFETDGLGHITKVLIQKYIVKDTITHVKTVENTTHAYEEDSVSVGAIKIKVTTKTDEGAEQSAEDYVNIVSETLSISTDNNHASIKGGSTAEAGISINMVWGEF